MRITSFFVSLAALLTLSPIAALAAPYQYTFTGVGSGIANGAAFNSAGFTVSFTGDSSNVAAVPSPAAVLGTASLNTGSVAIDGLTPLSFQNPLQVFVNNTAEIVGVRDTVLRTDIFHVSEPGIGLDTYALNSDFGPITDATPGFNFEGTALSVPLNLGALQFSDIASLTFTSTMAVPLPAVAWLFPSGLLAGLAWVRRQRPA